MVKINFTATNLRKFDQLIEKCTKSGLYWMNANNFGWWLKLAMESNGYKSYEELAEDANVSSSTIRDYQAQKGGRSDHCPIKIYIFRKIVIALGEDPKFELSFNLTNNMEMNAYWAQSLFEYEDDVHDDMTLNKEEIDTQEALDKIKNIFFQLNISECYLLSNYFDTYNTISKDAWDFLYTFNTLSHKAKNSLKIQIYQMQTSIKEQLWLWNTSHLNIYSEIKEVTKGAKDPSYDDLISREKNLLTESDQISETLRKSMWLGLLKKLSRSKVKIDKERISKIDLSIQGVTIADVMSFSERISEYVAMEEEDWDILIAFDICSPSQRNMLQTVADGIYFQEQYLDNGNSSQS